MTVGTRILRGGMNAIVATRQEVMGAAREVEVSWALRLHSLGAWLKYITLVDYSQTPKN